MARIVITEFMDEGAVASLRAAHDVLYDAKLVDDAPRLLKEAAGAAGLARDAIMPAAGWPPKMSRTKSGRRGSFNSNVPKS